MTPADRELLEGLVSVEVVEPVDTVGWSEYPDGEWDDARKDDVATTPYEHDAFADMLERGYPLTEKQRAWALRVAGRVGQLPPADNSHVPRGREVELPAVLRELPKKPPGRRTA